MKRLSLRWFLFGVPIAGTCAFLSLAWPQAPLLQAEREINRLYETYRPFAYRWRGAPPGGSPSKDCVTKIDTHKAQLWIDQGEQGSGQSAQSLQLAGRLELLRGQFDNAMSKYQRALRLSPDDWDIKLELAIAYAARAGCEDRALDYEYALEQMLAVEQKHQTLELAFDLALLFEEVPLPRGSIGRWEKVIPQEPSTRWRWEAEERLRADRGKLQNWNARFEELTASPGSYLVYADQASDSIELVLMRALESWLPNYRTDEMASAALNHLAVVLRNEHKDDWLWALLQGASQTESSAAFKELISAIKENNQGNHIRAELHAKTAQHLFERLHTPAGQLRARLERVYSLDRQWRQEECLDQVNGLRGEAEALHYQWITGQSWLEEITCQTETRHVDVIREREQAYEWINRTGYESLRLRAASFLTEQSVSGDRRLRIWSLGREGLGSFWKNPTTVNRGYTFYYTLGSSARSAGNGRAALALLEEGVSTLESTPYLQLLALALSDRGAWEFYQRQDKKWEQTFDHVDQVFKDVRGNPQEVEKFQRMAEVTRAEVDLKRNEAQASLSRMQQTIQKMPFPYRALSPVERRRLLPVLGEAFLKTGDLEHAKKIFSQLISENRHLLRKIHSRAQRDNAQREIESAWKGLTEIWLREGKIQKALYTWEAFRGGRLGDPYPQAITPSQGVALLTYAFLPGGLSAWLTDATGTKYVRVDAPEIVSRNARDFAALAADPDSPLPAVTKGSKELYASLLQPFEQRLNRCRLLIIDADAVLAAIPWAAIEDTRGQPLIEKVAFSQVIGWAEVANKLGGKKTVDLSHPLIVANPLLSPKLDREYPPLPDAEREAEWLHQQLPQSLLRKKQEATVRVLLDLLPNSTLLHFAGHGVSHGGFGALLLPQSPGKPSQLTAEEIVGLQLSRLQLVVLAACSSGIGEQGAVNLDSLARSFLEAGTARVVAARWDVSSRETVSMMEEFYQALLQGSRPAEALRQAASIVRRRTAHPYYWAGFQVYGAP